MFRLFSKFSYVLMAAHCGEQEAVEEWLNSNKKFHIMRDHPDHGTEILGGTWGCKLTQEVKLLRALFSKGPMINFVE